MMKKLSLLQSFSLVSLAAFVVIGIISSVVVGKFLEDHMLTMTTETTSKFIARELEHEMIGLELAIPKKGLDAINLIKRINHLNLGPNVLDMKIWSNDHIVIWSPDENMIGRHYPDNRALTESLQGKPVSETKWLKKYEQSFDSRYERLMELYVPFNYDENHIPRNVFEVYINLDPVYADIRKQQATVWFLTFAGAFLLYVTLYWIVRRASNKLVAQEQELQDSYDIIESARKEWEETFETINDAITIHDSDFNIIRANKAAEELLGLPYLTITRQKCYESYHGTGCPPEGCPSCQTLQTGVASTTQLFEPQLNKYIEIKAIPRLNASGKLIGLIHVVRDVTEHKKLEDQLRHIQKMEAIGTLAGGIAHDFNNVLNVIMGYSDILYRSLDKDNPLRASIDEIIVAAERAAHLTRSLLAFSRKEVIEKRLCNINEIVIGVKKMLTRIIGENIEVSTRLAEREITVMADSGQLEQMLINLATNARDAMPDGGMFIIETEVIELDSEFIQVYGYGTPGRYALISVTDTGIGMDEQTRIKIFEPFFTTKEVGKGTGLGLSIVYGTVKQHGGYINVYSEPGKGTTFKVYLPLSVTAADESIPATENPIKGGTETILIAEDDKAILKLTGSVLEQFGYRVIPAVDGEDALAKYHDNRGKINLVLLDIMMPKKKGQEVYDEIRKFTPGMKALFFSGYTADVLNKKGMLEKEINFISKPVSVNELLRRVREVLDR